MLAAFKRQAWPFIDPMPINDFECMFVAQHHGLPTRLVDIASHTCHSLGSRTQTAPASATLTAKDALNLSRSTFSAQVRNSSKTGHL
jgi:FRG domain-containing protein